MIARLATAAALVALLASPAAAQDPSAPSEEPLQPDRPDVANGTHIVDTGLLQLEIGGLFTNLGGRQGQWGTPVTARLGLNAWLEARVGTDGLLAAGDANGFVTGMGNVQVGAKLRLWADPGGVPVLSILPTINLPAASAEKGLGSGDIDMTVAFLTGTDFATRGHVDLNYGIGAIGAGGGRPHFTQHLVAVSASVAATAQWNPYFETFWVSQQDADGNPATAIDTGAIYTISPRFAIDGGVQVGLSEAAPPLAVFGGFSVIVGAVLGEHGVHARQRRAVERARAAGHR